MGISTHTRRVLWGRSGGLCAKCGGNLIEDASPEDREALSGQECHVISAALGGPRHGPAPVDGYDAVENLLLLCASCHRIVDEQPNTYDSPKLRRMKADHEQMVSRRLKQGKLPQIAISPMPDRVELDLIASGRQLVALVNGTQEFVIDHDQPRSDRDADLMAGVADMIDDADIALHALGPGEAVRLSHQLQDFLIEQLLPAGLVMNGAVVHRQMTVAGEVAPWATCVLTIRYAPKATHGDRHPSAGPVLSDEIRRLLKEGRRLQSTVRIPEDGASGPIEVWEQSVIGRLEELDRPDLATRFQAATGGDAARGLISARWQARARFERQLQVLSSFAEADS